MIIDKETKAEKLLCRTEEALKIALEGKDMNTIEVVEVNSHTLIDPMEQ